jgi:hypothetical protein
MDLTQLLGTNNSGLLSPEAQRDVNQQTLMGIAASGIGDALQAGLQGRQAATDEATRGSTSRCQSRCSAFWTPRPAAPVLLSAVASLHCRYSLRPRARAAPVQSSALPPAMRPPSWETRQRAPLAALGVFWEPSKASPSKIGGR